MSKPQLLPHQTLSKANAEMFYQKISHFAYLSFWIILLVTITRNHTVEVISKDVMWTLLSLKAIQKRI